MKSYDINKHPNQPILHLQPKRGRPKNRGIAINNQPVEMFGAQSRNLQPLARLFKASKDIAE